MQAARSRHIGYPTPLSILGSACVLWLKADHFDVATGVSRIYDRAKGSAQDAVQATAGAQPTYGISTAAGRPYIKGDGVDDQMTVSLASTIVAGSRPWLWLVHRATNTTSGIPVALHNTGDNAEAAYFVNDSSHFRFGMVSAGHGSGVDVNSNVFDTTNLHLHECGFPATTVGRYVLDGVPFDSVDSTGTFRDINQVTLFFFKGGGTPSNWNAGESYELCLADSQPNADQFAHMRNYFRRSYPSSLSIS